MQSEGIAVRGRQDAAGTRQRKIYKRRVRKAMIPSHSEATE